MKKIIPAVLLCFACLFSACEKEQEKMSVRQIYAMDTVCSVAVYGDGETVDRIAETIYELDRELSAYDGKVKELNTAGEGVMSENIRELLLMSVELGERTDGAFSPYLGSIIELWGIGEKNHIPTESEISELLLHSEGGEAEISGDVITLQNRAKLNFGAVAKGYASDKIREILKEEKVKSAMISLGGNVYVHGKKPDGSLWRVGLRDPKGAENSWFCTLNLENRFVISSGDYERYFECDGKRYHHIIDPKTGKPAESDLLSVTVISESGARGDAFSTALYVMGEKKALRFWREQNGFELVLVCRDGRVIFTEGLSESFMENEEAGYTYETACR